MKKLLSLLLLVAIMVPMIAIPASAADGDVAEPEYVTGLLNFDTTTAGWGEVTKVSCHIWAYNGDAFASWQSKKEACTDADKDGIWTYDIGAKGFKLEVGQLYAVIFSSGENQTYDLLFDSTVLGDTAYCDGTIYENPEDSSKTAQAAFWRGQDADVFGPEKKITSIGNVVGTCIPNVTTAQGMLETFLADAVKLENVRTFSLKEDQAIVDDIANSLGLTKADVETAIANSGAEVAWTAENSTIVNGGETPTEPETEIPTVEETEAPTEAETVAPTVEETEAPTEEDTKAPDYIPTEAETVAPTVEETVAPTEVETVAPTTAEPEYVTGVLNFDTTTAGWGDVTKVSCHIWAYNGDAFASWQSKKEACTDADKDGIWTYDIGAKGFEIEVGQLYAVIFSSGENQTYDLLFDSTVLGDTAYCDGTIYENPEDSTKTAQAAFWRGQDADVFGPEKKITSIGNVVGTCIPNVTTAQGMLEAFLSDAVKLENVRTFSLKEDQAIVDDIAKGLGLTKADVEEAIANTGSDVAWTAENSTLGDAPVEPEGILGDVTGDGVVDVMDATAIQMHIAKLETLTDDQLKLADTTKDGAVDVTDASRIQQLIAKIITEF